MTSPTVLIFLFMTGAVLLARFLEHRKNLYLRQLGEAIDEGAGAAYRYLVIKSMPPGHAYSQAEFDTNSRSAIEHGLNTVKEGATINLPKDETIKARIDGKLGLLQANDVSVSPITGAASVMQKIPVTSAAITTKDGNTP